jgi:putative nucleotidyltransferase with HDIG domain
MEELEQGKIVTGLYLIEKISVNGRLVELELNSGTNKTFGVLKDNVDLFTKTYSVGEKVFCKGRIRKRRKNFCLDIIYISKNMLETKIQNKINLEKLVARFDELISLVSDLDYKKVLQNCFNDDVRDLFFEYPAAKENHHSYTHGLLQHSIEVVDICLFFTSYFEDLDKDLLICAGLLHDIGKLKSYDINEDLKIEKTAWDSLLGHLPISALFVSKIIPQEIEPQKIMLLYHMILSHHGELHHGSPVICKTKESYLLNKADEISSTLGHIDNLKFEKNWSEPDKINSNRTWYRSIIDNA